MKKSIVLLLVVLVVVLSCSFVLAKSFSDVAKDHWAYPVISSMAEKSIVNGYPDGTFGPNKAVTRAPINKSNNGNLTISKKLVMISTKSALLLIASLMVFKPKKSKPKPAKISPMFLTCSFLMNIKMTPITAKTIKYLEMEIDDKEAIKPVTVVPT